MIRRPNRDTKPRPEPTPLPRIRWEIIFMDGVREVIHSYYRTVSDGVYYFYDTHDWRSGSTYPTDNIRRCQPIGIETDPTT